MNQRNRQPFTGATDRVQAPSAVRVIAPENVPGALAAAGRTSEVAPHREPIVARPEQVEELTDVVDHLRARRAVLLELEGLVDGDARHRGLAFVSGAAYALEVTVTRSGDRRDVILLDPCAPDNDRVGTGDGAAPSSARRANGRSAPNGASRAGTCVLCDLRTADREFQPPLEMVITRDGSRIWSPPAMVCSHCRETIRHWKFALAWCSECERWGRRNVVSPCGHLYG
jgi:FtsZ-interacting cell division protein YlmF